MFMSLLVAWWTISTFLGILVYSAPSAEGPSKNPAKVEIIGESKYYYPSSSDISSQDYNFYYSPERLRAFLECLFSKEDSVLKKIAQCGSVQVDNGSFPHTSVPTDVVNYVCSWKMSVAEDMRLSMYVSNIKLASDGTETLILYEVLSPNLPKLILLQLSNTHNDVKIQSTSSAVFGEFKAIGTLKPESSFQVKFNSDPPDFPDSHTFVALNSSLKTLANIVGIQQISNVYLHIAFTEDSAFLEIEFKYLDIRVPDVYLHYGFDVYNNGGIRQRITTREIFLIGGKYGTIESSAINIFACTLRKRSKEVCNGFLEINNETETIMSPYYPDKYPPNLNCSWTIKVTGNSRVSLTLMEFDVDMGGDFLYINTPNTTYGPLTGNYNQFVETPIAILNPGETGTITFVSNNETEIDGFLVTLTTDELGLDLQEGMTNSVSTARLHPTTESLESTTSSKTTTRELSTTESSEAMTSSESTTSTQPTIKFLESTTSSENTVGEKSTSEQFALTTTQRSAIEPYNSTTVLPILPNVSNVNAFRIYTQERAQTVFRGGVSNSALGAQMNAGKAIPPATIKCARQCALLDGCRLFTYDISRDGLVTCTNY